MNLAKSLAFLAALLAGCDDPLGVLCDAVTEHHRAQCAADGAGSESCAWLDDHATAAGTCR